MSTYTEYETKKLIQLYEENPCLATVRKLCVTFNKPQKSIISKLVKEGVYVTQGYVDKQGNKPITKLQIVRNLESLLDTKLMGLDKAPKGTLRLLMEKVTDMYALAENAELNAEKLRVAQEMLKQRAQELMK